MLQSHSQVRLEGVRLGDAVNLLHGADLASITGASALHSPPRVPLRQFAADAGRLAEPGWSLPTVTVHHDVESLAARLSIYRVERRLFDGPGFSIRPGALLRSEGRVESQRRLGEVLGVELAAGQSYLLLELRRIDGRADHEVTAEPTRRFFDRKWHLTPEWRAAKSQLRPGRRIHDGDQHDAIITATMAQSYLDCCYAFGTHFVSAVEAGDALIQVIALRPESRADVSRYWRQIGGGHAVEGTAALTFAPFAGPLHAMETGHIASLAGDPHLPASIARGTWSNPAIPGKPSLLAVFRRGQEAACRSLAEFRAIAPVGVELTSIARFMEFFRALNFERVFRGAMLQRWGDRPHLTLRRLPGTERAVAAVARDDAPATSLGGSVPDRHHILRLRGRNPHRLPAPAGKLLTQFLDAEPACHQASILRLSGTAFERGGIVCQTMAGALILENESGSERDAVVDGLRFTGAGPEPGTGWPRVRVRGDMHTLDVRDLAEVLSSIQAALAAASAILCSAEAADARVRADAASFAEWLASLLPADAGDPAVRRLRVIALYLARIESRLPIGDISHEETSARMHDCFAGISAAAIEADMRLRDHGAQLRVHARSSSPRAGAPLRAEESDPLEGFHSLNRCVSRHYGLLLEEICRRHLEALERAALMQRDSAAVLAEAVTELRGAFAGREPGPASSLVLQAIASASSASCSRQEPPHPGDNLPGRRREALVDAALEFAGREARLRTQAAQLDAIEALCGVLTDDPAALGAAERGFAAVGTAMVDAPSGDAGILRAAIMMDGPYSGIALERPLTALMDAWTRFDAARRELLAARSASCRVRMEIWHQWLLGGEIPARDGTAQHQLQLEYFHLLITVGLALRHQQAALRSAGLSSPAATPGNSELGALGHLMALQGALLINRLSRRAHGSQPNGRLP